MSELKSKAQSWSIDIIIGVLVFIGAFFIVYALLNSNPESKATNLKEEASIVIKKVTSEGSLKIVDGNEVNESKLGELKNLTYQELKRFLGIEGDFCIYFEDDKGNLVLINNSYRGIGAPSINLSDSPCSQK
jgi:hypothetical protein